METEPDSDAPRRLKWFIRFVRLVGLLVPRWRRAEWQQEWETELWYEVCAKEPASPSHSVVKRTLGALPHAAWLLRHHWSLDTMASDLAFALRVLRRQRGYTVASTLTLALGIGATTAVFAVIDASLIRPLPYRDPHGLVGLNSLRSDPNGQQTAYSLSQIELVRWRAATHSFEAIEALEPRTVALTGQGDPEVLQVAAVSSGLFRLLGIEPQLGRTFTDEEERTDAPRAVISDSLWRLHFNADASVLGRVMRLDGQSFDIIGVMPSGFHPLLDQSVIWVPLHPLVDPARQNLRVMASTGRLRPGATHAQAERELAGISAELAREFPTSHNGMTPQVLDLQEQLLGQRRPGLVALGGGVLLLLLLACVNVLNLTLGHLSTRRSEFAVRAAIGAGRWRLARLQLVENALLAAVGGATGIALMVWTLPAFLRLSGRDGQPPIDAGLDWRVAGFGALVIGGTALLSGVVPAIRAHAASFGGVLTQVSSGRIGGGRWERRLRDTLVVAQVALAVTLLCGAGLFAASLGRLLAAPRGFAADGVLSMQLMLSPVKYADVASRARFVQQMLERVAALPGVVATGTTQTTFLPNQSMQTLFWIDGRPIDGDHTEMANIRHITPGYFPSLGVRVIEGRAIDERDQIGTPPVCMVSAQFAKRFLPNEHALGHRIRRTSATAQWMTIVGVTQDVMDAGLGVQQGPTLYVDYLQVNTPTARVSLVVRTPGDPLSIAGEVRRAIWSLDSSQPLDRVERLNDVLVESTGDQQFRTVLLSAFAVVGLALALVGVYGVTAAAVTARTWEVGVRLALGERPSRVVLHMLAEAGRRVILGVVAGIALFLAVARIAVGLLYHTSTVEPIVLSVAIVPVCAMSLFVCYVQARRLAHVSPMSALRDTAR